MKRQQKVAKPQPTTTLYHRAYDCSIPHYRQQPGAWARHQACEALAAEIADTTGQPPLVLRGHRVDAWHSSKLGRLQAALEQELRTVKQKANRERVSDDSPEERL